MIGYEQKLARVLGAMGGLYTLNDLIDRINDGRMQSFVVNNTWAITEIQDFPRVRKIHVVALVGDLGDIDAIQAELVGFADRSNAGLISAYGRRGWIDMGRARGWRLVAKSNLFHRDM